MQYCSTKLFEIAVKSKYPATTTTENTQTKTHQVLLRMKKMLYDM